MCVCVCVCVCLCSVVSDSVTPEALPARLLYPWNFPGKNTEAGCHFPLQGMDLTDPGIEPVSCVSCIGRWILYHCTTWETYIYTYIIEMVFHKSFLNTILYTLTFPLNYVSQKFFFKSSHIDQPHF